MTKGESKMADSLVENNVPRELWLYPDRGMMKWMGWLLSDHSAYLEEAAKSEKPQQPLSEMTFADINATLQTAWEQSQSVAVQLAALYNDQYLPLIEGAVVGLVDGQVYLQPKSGRPRMLAVADIRHVEPLDTTKWWDQ